MSVVLRIENAEQFEALFHEWYPVLCRASHRVLRDKSLAEEIVQEVFVNLWEKREQIVVQGAWKSYLYRSALNRSFNEIKRAQRTQGDGEALMSLLPDGADSSELLRRNELSARIEKALDTLPPVCRHVFVLSRHEELSYKEIAEQLNISVKTVENHMGKALKRLREELGDYLTIIVLLSFIGIN